MKQLTKRHIIFVSVIFLGTVIIAVAILTSDRLMPVHKFYNRYIPTCRMTDSILSKLKKPVSQDKSELLFSKADREFGLVLKIIKSGHGQKLKNADELRTAFLLKDSPPIEPTVFLLEKETLEAALITRLSVLKNWVRNYRQRYLWIRVFWAGGLVLILYLVAILWQKRVKKSYS